MTDENKTDEFDEAENISHTPAFEELLEELETIVDRLENEELTLDESVKQFERGMELALICNKLIGHSEQKIEMLIEKNSKLILEPFEGSN